MSTENEVVTVDGVVEDEQSDRYVVRLRKPFVFEGKTYTEVDMSGIEDITTEDLISVEKIMRRGNPGIEIMPEMSTEYACLLAARAAKLPVEFFYRLPRKDGLMVRNRIMGFLYGAE